MAEKFFGTACDGTPIMRDVEADIAEGRKLLTSMNSKEMARWLKKQGKFDVVIILNNQELGIPAPCPDCYHPYSSGGLPDLDKLVDIDGKPVPFPRKLRWWRKKMGWEYPDNYREVIRLRRWRKRIGLE